jgi:hypothetical protein
MATTRKTKTEKTDIRASARTVAKVNVPAKTAVKNTTVTGKILQGSQPAATAMPAAMARPAVTPAANQQEWPTSMLNQWMEKRTHWNHDDWNGLLDALNKKGFTHIASCGQGQQRLGEWLEERRAERHLPKQELDAWVGRHAHWDHGDWLVLLGDLRDCGYSSLADSQIGQKAIGHYIERRRSEIHGQ